MIFSTTILTIALLVGDFEADVVVYGGTSGGITAAIQTVKMGKTVVLIEPSQHLGGLTAGGLGATDIGNEAAIGGLSREFYRRVAQHYAIDAHWKYESKRKSPPEDAMWTFEPHVARDVYNAWLTEKMITPILGERLDLNSGVQKDGVRITALRMESGKVFRGKVFIDATYEGDLLAQAGVSFHVGRESNSDYDETLNGVQVERSIHHQFIKPVDPFRKPGDPTSGLLPLIQTERPGTDGEGDHRIQAYNFRMCTTDVAENRRDWPKPEGYDEAEFELLLRNCEAGDLRSPWNPVWLPNRKTDTNNNFAISTDYIGKNYAYPEGDYTTRQQIFDDHRRYQQGLMYTLANHPRVPVEIRAAFQKLGLAKDEFVETDNWPHQMYVREARRMVTDYVMTQHHCQGRKVPVDPVGMGAYNMDSHNCSRFVNAAGHVRNEGDLQVGVSPYPISYRSIHPRREQCTNLLVPVCLAATHIAYGSIRMEPVFMVMGQSAATAAALSIDAGCTVQALDYAVLKARLEKDGQMLDFESPPVPEHRAELTKEGLGGIVVDDSEAELKGFESEGHTTSPFLMNGYRHDGNEAKGAQTATFTPDLPKAGMYRIAITYTALANRASNVPVTVNMPGHSLTLKVNQQTEPELENHLRVIGSFSLPKGKGSSVEISNKGTDGHVIIDAVQWLAE